MWLSREIVEDVTDAVKVFYVDFAATRYWAEKRAKGEPLVFTGWYWALGGREGGPFKSKSACYRDAWYRVCNKQSPPALRQKASSFEHRKHQRENRAKHETAGVAP